MASVISRIQSNGINYALAHSAFAICETESSDPNKVATICTGGDNTNNDFKVVDGVSVMVKFENEDSEIYNTPITLSVNGAKASIVYGSLALGAIDILQNVKYCSFKSQRIYQFVYHGQGHPDSYSEPYWEVVGDSFHLLEPLRCYYNPDTGYISHSFIQMLYYALYQSMFSASSVDGAFYEFLNLSHIDLQCVSNTSGELIKLDCVGLTLVGEDGLDNMMFVFRQHLCDFTLTLIVDIYDNVSIQYDTFQPLLNADNKLSHEFIDMPYSVTKTTSGGNEIITFA